MLPMMMFRVGQDVLQSIIDGIDSILGSLMDKIADIARSIASKLNPANWGGSPIGMQHWLPYYFEQGLGNLQKSINSMQLDTSPLSGAMSKLGPRGREQSAAAESLAAASSSGQGVEVHFNGPVTIEAQDRAAAERSTSTVGWAIAQGMRARGVWAA